MNKLLVLVCYLLVTATARAQLSAASDTPSLPPNVGLGLWQLAAAAQQDQAAARDAISSSKSVMTDSAGRVVVNINLDGTAPAVVVSAKLVPLGLDILAVETKWRHGVISAWMPVGSTAAVAKLSGVRSVMLARRPIRHVGAVTAESSVVEHTRDVNTPGSVTPNGVLGRGITVGLVSDSFDAANGVSRASVGVASGDLPGPGNPDGYSQPVVVLSEGSSADSDEGRAMAEIVHDLAPAAKIAFSTSGPTQATMAASIRNLRTSGNTQCDVIADDISFTDEPYFSDGIIAQAVEDVVASSSLAGKKVSYFSAAGNDSGGYAADASIVSSSVGQSHRGNLNFSQVPPALYAGGFQNFGSSAAPVIASSMTTGAETSHELVLQWDDPFNTGSVSTDYNLLVFDANGNYLSSVSSTDTNQYTDEPIEVVELQASTTYQVVISLATGGSPTARHLRLVADDGSTITGTLLASSGMAIVGHAAAAGANCVAAYIYNNTPNLEASYNPNATNPPPGPYEPALESFSSTGGSLPFYFNPQGQRLANPELRLKPDFAAADGVDTSFFPPGSGNDTDNDGFPNFFGTSAAAPTAAAIAALVLEASGGPNSRTPAQIHSILQASAGAHDLDPAFSQATAAAGGNSVQVKASGDDSNASADSPTFFTVTFNGNAGVQLSQVSIDLTNPSLVFDDSADVGLPFTVGQNTANVPVSSSLSADKRVLTLHFGNGFTSGNSISFGIDRDFAGINADGNSADFLGGASITAFTSAFQTLYGAFANQLGDGFEPTDGYGFIDAKTAVQAIVGRSPSGSGPANLSTRGLVGSGADVLIGSAIIDGTAAKKVIVRALGPSLGIAGQLSDPTLTLYDANGQQFAADDNWQDDPAQAAQIRATGIAPKDSRESAVVETLTPAAYTAIVRGAGGSTGIGIVEIYDLDAQPAACRLANIATRGSVQTGDDVLIGGFILTRASSVIIRALGPSLASAGISGFLADPSLELHDSQGTVITSNDNWQQDAYQASQLESSGVAPKDPLESAIVTTLQPGAYTPIVRGRQGTTGVGQVEVYDLP